MLKLTKPHTQRPAVSYAFTTHLKWKMKDSSLKGRSKTRQNNQCLVRLLDLLYERH